MPYSAEVYNIMIASPGDVSEERKIAREIILDWNNIHSHARKVVLMPVGWELNSFPSMGDRPQEVINQQILKNADILIGIFWTRIGTPTGKAPSGTVEEIEEHIASGKPAMLYFSNKPVVPSSINAEQYNMVIKLRENYQTRGLTDHFISPNDFKVKFQRHLTMLLNKSEYQVQKINEADDVSNDITSDWDFSPAAKTMLIETSKDSSGQILKHSFKGGFKYETNGLVLNEDFSPRTMAKWEDALSELLLAGLIVENYRTKGTFQTRTHQFGRTYQMTNLGYTVADSLTG